MVSPMTQLQNDMSRAVDDFVSQITSLARRAAFEAIGAALGVGGKAANGTRIPGEKRAAQELEKTSAAFREFVAKNPGLRIEQINAKLGTSTKDLALPIRKMVADGTIKTKGAKRSTTYYAGSKG